MDRRIEYIIDASSAGKTVKDFLLDLNYSSQNLTDLKKATDGIFHNGSRAYVTETLEVGDIVTVNIHDSHSSEKIPPVEMELDIVYEDEDVVIVNKPADMPTHPSMNNYENTLANGLVHYYAKQGKEFVFRSINRLDRNTTGLVLIAKNAVSGAMLSGQVREGIIKKEYVAITQGRIDVDNLCAKYPAVIKGTDDTHFTIDVPIARVEGSTIKRRVHESGERAVTHVKVFRKSENISVVICELETGRTHQIRVHMSHIGHPLLGDGMYNPENKDMARQALHCRSIGFVQPITGEYMEISIPLADDMLEVVSKM